RHVHGVIATVEAKLATAALEAGVFSSTLGLLAAVADPAKAKQHVEKLQKLSVEIAENRRQLEIDRKEFSEKVAAAHAELEKRERRVRSDGVALMLTKKPREEPADQAFKQLTGRSPPPSRTVQVAGPGSLAQTIYPDEQQRDAHFG